MLNSTLFINAARLEGKWLTEDMGWRANLYVWLRGKILPAVIVAGRKYQVTPATVVWAMFVSIASGWIVKHLP